MLHDTPEEHRTVTADIEDIEQAGAICIRQRKSGERQVLLVGSLRNGRWGLPKGHIEPNESTMAAAEREAFEEAGVRGSTSSRPFGTFLYFKDSSTRRYRVTVHLLQVTTLSKSFPERNVRKSKWFSIDEASREASQPGLRTLLQLLR